jgi:hypothetical protein
MGSRKCVVIRVSAVRDTITGSTDIVMISTLQGRLSQLFPSQVWNIQLRYLRSKRFLISFSFFRFIHPSLSWVFAFIHLHYSNLIFLFTLCLLLSAFFSLLPFFSFLSLIFPPSFLFSVYLPRFHNLSSFLQFLHFSLFSTLQIFFTSFSA